MLRPRIPHLSLLVALSPLLAGPLSASELSEGSDQPDAPPAQAAGSYEGLVAEFAALDAELKAAAKQAPTVGDRAALRAERKRLPALYWPRMEAAADAGEGQALLWMAKYAKKAGVPKQERGATKRALYTRVLAEHAQADWLGEALVRIALDRRDLGTEGVAELLAGVLDSAAAIDLRIEAAFLIAAAYEKQKDAAGITKAVEWYRRIIVEFADSPRAAEAEDRIFGLEQLQIGMVAPDIEGTDLDGVAFKLSDYRGKVVVLDFWGDW